MSITVSTAQAAISLVQAGGSTTKGQAASGDSAFFDTLSQCMNQDCSVAGNQGTSAVLPTAGGITEMPEEAVDPLMSLIESLLKDLEQAEQQLEEDPELFAMLQQWLTQAQSLTGTNADTSESFQMLASNPAALNILVRDQLEQLRSVLSSTGSNQSASAVQEGMKMLESLQVLLNRAHPSASAVQLDQTTNSLSTTDRIAASTTVKYNEAQSNGFAQESVMTSVLSESSAEVVTAGQFALRAEGVQTSQPVQVIRAGQFVQDMGSFMVKQLHITARNGVSEAKITLYPESLGQVDIRLTMQNGQLIAQFVTEQAMAKELLDQQMSMLRGALQAQGIQVEKLEVSQQVSTASNLSSSMFHSDQQSNSSRDQAFSRQTRNLGDSDGEYESLEDIKSDIILEQLRGSSFQASV